jgi:hypothetical protein
MTLLIRPMAPADLLAIDPQAAQADVWRMQDLADVAVDLLRAGEAMTVRDADGRVLLIGGVRPVHDECLWLWSILSGQIGARMVALSRAVARWLDGHGVRRLQFTCAVEHEEGLRWAALLGFQMEARLQAFGEDGGDHLLFARIRGDD